MPEDIKQAFPGKFKLASEKTQPERKPLFVETKPLSPRIDIYPAAKQKKPAQTAEKSQANLLYKAAKALYKRNLFQEAIIGFQDILRIDPSHWRANWFLKKSQNKLLKQRVKSQKKKQSQLQVPIEAPEEDFFSASEPMPAAALSAEKFAAEIEKVKQELEQKTAQEEQKIKELEQQIISDRAMLKKNKKPAKNWRKCLILPNKKNKPPKHA